MSCAACSSRVEKALSALSGVTECSVNLLTGSAAVSGSATEEEVISAVEAAGYGCTLAGADAAAKKTNKEESKPQKSTLWSFVFSTIILAVLMYFSMGTNMMGFPLPPFFAENPIGVAILQMLCALSVMILLGRFFTSGFSALLKRSPNMDSLVAIGSASGFIYSVAVLFSMTKYPENASFLLHNLYFESSAMILVLIRVGKMLEKRAKNKTGDALRALARLSPEFATVEREGKEIQLPLSELSVGDIFLVRPGERVCADGFIISGRASIDESAISGESVPVDKKEGDTVIGATLNTSGFLRVRATRVGGDTVLSKIISAVEDASATKAPIARLADKVAGVFVPIVMAIALLTAIIHLILSFPASAALSRAVAVLVISCPCSLGLATPVAIMVGCGVGARHQVLFKSAEALELCGRAKTVVLDKTGTVTSGNISVTDVIPEDGISGDTLLSFAYSVENKSEHPLARSIVSHSERTGTPLIECSDFFSSIGAGVGGIVNNEEIFGGKVDFISEKAGITLSKDQLSMAEKVSEEGKTPIFFAKRGAFLGLIALSDTVRQDSAEAISKMRKTGLRVVLLSGDNERVCANVSKSVGIPKFYHSANPDFKAKKIEELKKDGKVIMIGDGINDAVALTSADVGMAIGAGTDIARDSAGIILMRDSLFDALFAIKLSRATLKNIKENLFWAFFYNCIGIPVAAGALSGLGITLSPMLAALAMGLSSIFVVSNALRLNFFKSDSKSERKKENKMEKVVKIEGMMCPHCEAHVKGALEEIEGVAECVASHTEKCARLTLTSEISEKAIKEAVEKAGYKVID